VQPGQWVRYNWGHLLLGYWNMVSTVTLMVTLPIQRADQSSHTLISPVNAVH